MDANKGSLEQPNIRSRLVALEMRSESPELAAAELFSSMPPLKAVKLLGSLSRQFTCLQEGQAVASGVLRHFESALLLRTECIYIYIDVPQEDETAVQLAQCGLLCKTMYGTRDASNVWQSPCTKQFVGKGFQQGVVSPSLFWHPVEDGVHGDDFVVWPTTTALRTSRSC